MDGTRQSRIVITGTAESMGRHALDAAEQNSRVICLANCSQAHSGAPLHPNILWVEVDISDREATASAFEAIQGMGGADVVLHLAARAEATTSPTELERVNLHGLRNVLEQCRKIEPKRVLVATPEPSEGRRDPDEPAPAVDQTGSDTDDWIDQVVEEYRDCVVISRLQVESRPRVVVTGASGFIGRHLLEAIKEDYQVLALARASQSACGAPVHRNISWFQVDISDRDAVLSVFDRIRKSGRVDLIVHLAAYYEFNKEDHPLYWSTNVEGLRNVLDGCRALRPRRFLFASSAAACGFPRRGAVLTEESAADGDHAYAITKRIGEQMLSEYSKAFPSTIVRFAALFSDWCEYPPLFVSLQTWLSSGWTRRVLGGRGQFAIPYLHVRDTIDFLLRAMARADEVEPNQVLLASTDGANSVKELFETTTRIYFGSQHRSIYLPRPVCGLGLHVRDLVGRQVGERPFERPWMAKYIDRQLRVDATRTREILGWSPRERLQVERRLPFMVHKLRSRPAEWQRRNIRAMIKLRTTTNLRIQQLLEKNEQRILSELARRLEELAQRPGSQLARLPASELRWTQQIALHQLMNTVRTRDTSIFMTFCHDLAQRRIGQGFLAKEVRTGLRLLSESCLCVLSQDEEAEGLATEIEEQIGMAILIGCDQIEETFEAGRG